MSDLTISRLETWANSFHDLMNDIMGRDELYKYLSDEGSSELAACIKFWLAWVGFKSQLKTTESTEQYSGFESWQFAKKAYKRFFNPKKSPKDFVQLSPHVASELQDRFDSAFGETSVQFLSAQQIRDMFQDPFYEVEKRLSDIAHRNFLQSDRYIDLLNQAISDADQQQQPAADELKSDANSEYKSPVSYQHQHNNNGHFSNHVPQQQQVLAAMSDEIHHYNTIQRDQQKERLQDPSSRSRPMDRDLTLEAIIDPIQLMVIDANSRAANSAFKEAYNRYCPPRHDDEVPVSMPFIINNNDPNFPTRQDVDLNNMMANNNNNSMSKRNRNPHLPSAVPMATLHENVEVRSASRASGPHARSKSCSRTETSNYPNSMTLPIKKSFIPPHHQQQPLLSSCSGQQQQLLHQRPQQMAQVLGPVNGAVAMSVRSAPTQLPPHPYHVHYNPKLPPSANDSEVNTRVSAASLSDVDYSKKPSEPISNREMRKMAEKSRTSASVNQKVRMPAEFTKHVPPPVRPSSSKHPDPRVMYDDEKDSKIRNTAEKNPHAFAGRVISILERHSNEWNNDPSVRRRRVIPDALNAVAATVTKKATGCAVDIDESDESILEDHLNTLHDWGKTPDRSGKESPRGSHRSGKSDSRRNAAPQPTPRPHVHSHHPVPCSVREDRSTRSHGSSQCRQHRQTSDRTSSSSRPRTHRHMPVPNVAPVNPLMSRNYVEPEPVINGQVAGFDEYPAPRGPCNCCCHCSSN